MTPEQINALPPEKKLAVLSRLTPDEAAAWRREIIERHMATPEGWHKLAVSLIGFFKGKVQAFRQAASSDDVYPYGLGPAFEGSAEEVWYRLLDQGVDPDTIRAQEGGPTLSVMRARAQRTYDRALKLRRARARKIFSSS
jgi:hypothetical protein